MKNKTIVVVLAVVAALCLVLCACAKEPTKYDIRFVNDDGTELATVSVEENGKVAYGGKTPAKASTAEFEYTFAGWTDENGVALTKLPAATANATYKARYTSAKRSYAVRFVNGETELQNETLAYGAAISYKGATPEKAATAAESYTFVGWATTADGKAVDIANATVTGEVTYYAVFSGTAVMYDVTWNVGGVETKSQVAYNGAPVYDKATPTKAATDIARYEFAGWAKTEDGKVVTIADEKVVADVTYYAVFTEVRTHFAVKFVSGSTELQNSLVASGAAPVYGGATPENAMTEAEVYTFKGWAKTADSTEVVDLAKESITADGVVY
uniref:InlB B-repeat-containing protein n=1 Tax=Candidatus Fimenecus sp. TaxID=3022888 RepID=UPI00402A1D89